MIDTFSIKNKNYNDHLKYFSFVIRNRVHIQLFILFRRHIDPILLILYGCGVVCTDFIRAKNDKQDRMCIRGEEGGMFESPLGTMTGSRCKRK